jgi:hypothetical protein
MPRKNSIGSRKNDAYHNAERQRAAKEVSFDKKREPISKQKLECFEDVLPRLEVSAKQENDAKSIKRTKTAHGARVASSASSELQSASKPSGSGVEFLAVLRNPYFHAWLMAIQCLQHNFIEPLSCFISSSQASDLPRARAVSESYL